MGRLAKLLALLASALGCGSAAGPQPAAPAAQSRDPEPAAAALGAPLLWEVEGPAGSSYLFGTVHLGISPDDIDPRVIAALQACDTFVTETDLRDINPNAVAELSLLPPGQTLESALGRDAFDELARELGPQMSRANLDKLQPWTVYVALLQRLFPTPMSVDEKLLDTAGQSDKRLVFLEDWRAQLGLLSKVIDGDDVKQILDPGSEDRKSLAAMIGAYKRGDFATIERLTASPEVIAKDPDEFASLFEKRNRAWLPTISRQLENGRAFVAVGAGHFAGESGLIALLSASGFEPRRIAASDVE